MYICIGILFFVMLLLFSSIKGGGNKRIINNSTIEMVWTLIPCLIILSIGYPSLHLLYTPNPNPDLTLVVGGRQWYWDFTFPDLDLSFSSYLLDPSPLRLHLTDNTLVLPAGTWIRVLTSSTDVMHSWGCAALGIKLDTVPGRINSKDLFILSPGSFLGHCYELCGPLHSQMPFNIEAVSLQDFCLYVLSIKDFSSTLFSALLHLF